MKDNPIRILSTRPLDEALIENAACQNITIDTISFIEIKKLVTTGVSEQINLLSQSAATVVFTSMNAVEVVVDALPADNIMPPWKIYCMGGATFTLVKKYWAYDSIVFTAKNAADLARKIVSDKIDKITFFCGDKRREELPGLLAEANVSLQEVVVYETIEKPVAVSQNYSAVLFFSPSAVNSFFSINHVPAETILFSIGNTTATAIKLFTGNRIIVSEFPAKDQLVEKAIEYFNQTADFKRQV
jgi:uroporphyrinogen-III synthase